MDGRSACRIRPARAGVGRRALPYCLRLAEVDGGRGRIKHRLEGRTTGRGAKNGRSVGGGSGPREFDRLCAVVAAEAVRAGCLEQRIA